MAMNKVANDLPLGKIQDLLENMQRQKRASANTEEGQMNGATTHPSGSTDDGTKPAATGKKETENTEMAKEKNPQGPDATGTINVSQDRVQQSFGTTQALTGEDPGTDRDYQTGYPDPGTSHPAKTEPVKSSFDKLSYLEKVKLAADMGNKLMSFAVPQIKLAEDHGGIIPENEEHSRFIKMSMELQSQYQHVLKNQKQAADQAVREAVMNMAFEGATRAALVAYEIKQASANMQAQQQPQKGANPPGKSVKRAEGVDPAMMGGAEGGEGEEIPGEEELLAQEMAAGEGEGQNDPNNLTEEDLANIMAAIEGGDEMPEPPVEDMMGGGGAPGGEGGGGGGLPEGISPEILEQLQMLQAVQNAGGAPKTASDNGNKKTKKPSKQATAQGAKSQMYSMLQELHDRSNRG